MKKLHWVFFLTFGMFLFPLVASASSCPSGSSRVGNACLRNCPKGWKTKGSICIKPSSHSYFSGAFSWIHKKKCTSGGYTCTKRGTLKQWYRDCKKGFTHYKVRNLKSYCHRPCSRYFAGGSGYGACKRRALPVRCKRGYSNYKGVCLRNCPKGWKTKGSLCIKPKGHVYFSGAFGWTKKKQCQNGGYTCKKRGTFKQWYRNCKSGFSVHKVRTFKYYCHRPCSKSFAGGSGYGACKRRR